MFQYPVHFLRIRDRCMMATIITELGEDASLRLAQSVCMLENCAWAEQHAQERSRLTQRGWQKVKQKVQLFLLPVLVP